MAQFIPRLKRPEAGNKYYITKGMGGYSDAIQGKPTDPNCNVLANCVGYAYGRFNEIGQWGYCRYLRPVNAENFIQYANGLEVGQTPKLGACMVWRKGATLSNSDGAGHVAIVEKIINDTQIVTSESGYNSSKPFWTQTRNKGNGNWGMGSAYVFLGFIYNPAVDDEGQSSDGTEASNSTNEENAEKPTSNATVPAGNLKFKVGDIVEFIGNMHFVNAVATSGPSCKPGKVKITAIFRNGYHQYHAIAVKGGGSSAYGWVDADKLRSYGGDANEETEENSDPVVEEDESKPTDFAIGDEVNFTGNKHYISAYALGGSRCNPGRARITHMVKSARHPYHVIGTNGGGSTVYGWVDADSIKPL